MEEDELPAPVPICLFGLAAEMSATADDRKLVEKAGRGGGGITP